MVANDLHVFYIGRLVDNYLEDATSAWDSTTVHKYTVPSGKRWVLLGGQVTRDANATLLIDAYNSDDKIIMGLSTKAAGTGQTNYPDYDLGGMLGAPLILDAGDYVKLTAGAAQGAGATSSCVVIELRL